MNFNKLISNLPFNPSLVGQVAFYAKRAHQEATLRRLGFAFIALAMFLQMFAVIVPPERSMAASNDHIINGLKTRTDILKAWDQPGSDIPYIYGKFGLTRQDISNLPEKPNAVLRSNAGPDYWTTGRNSLSGYSTVNYLYKLSEVALQAGPTTIYMRQLRAWDIKNPYNVYSAFQGTKADGTVYWILVDCGNYTQIGKFSPKNPGLEIRKTVTGNTNLKPGDSYTYRFEYRNTVPDSLAENVTLQDVLDLSDFDVVYPTNLSIDGNHLLRVPIGSLSYSSSYHVLDITVRLKNPFPGIKTVCNSAKLSASNAGDAYGGPACVNVTIPCQYNPNIPSDNPNCKAPTPCPYNPGIPATDANCKPPVAPCVYNPALPADSSQCVAPQLYCSLLDTALDRASRTATFQTTVTSTNQSATKIISYTYDYGDGKKQQPKLSTAFTDTVKYTYPAGDYNVNVAVAYSINGDSASTSRSVQCSDHISFESDKPLGESKSVKNITQNIEGDKVLNSTVNAGDVLEYTLVTSNSQNYARNGITISDYIGDVLDYGTLDTTQLQTDGGSYSEATKKVTWANVTIPASSQVSKTFRITIKNPVPSTNTPSGVSGTFDCKISNQYGNEVAMNVNCPVIKSIESLPNTGPGTSAAFACTVTVVVGYFFARSRIMARELELIKSDYAPTGGF